GRQPPAAGAGRGEGMVVDLTPRHRGSPLIEQAGQRPDQPGLALAALAEQDRVVPGQECTLQVREYGLAEPDDPGEPLVACTHPGQQVAPDLVFDRQVGVTALAQFRDRGDRGAGGSACAGTGLAV